MTDSTTPSFIDRRKPRLVAGRYEVTVRQSVEHLHLLPCEPATGMEVDAWQHAGCLEQKIAFHVTAPRWGIADDQIDRVFPPPGSKGDYSRFFPYVLIDNPTLPWERCPYAGTQEKQTEGKTPKPPETDTPWLALVMFVETLIHEATDVTGAPSPDRIRQGHAAPAIWKATDDEAPPATWAITNGVAIPRLNPEPTDRADTTVSVVDVPKALEKQLGLSAERVARHACVVQSPDAQSLGKAGEHALITCPDMPKPGRYRLMLLSLEGWLDSTHELVDIDICSATTHRRFVCLGQWSFTCSEETASFKEIAESIEVGLLVDAAPTDELHRQAGGYLMPMTPRDGLATRSWRRGPLVPARINVPSDFDPWGGRSAEELILDALDNGPADVSYAEAWEQGRLAALRKPVLAAALADCRRACVHKASDTGHLLCGEKGPQMPGLPTAWLSSLLRLEFTPYTSLVPSEAMLPAERLQFFLVDPNWLDCFLAGAVSLGRPYASCDCHSMEHHLKAMLENMPGRPAAGILLRSRLVAGWPQLEVTGQTDGGAAKPVRLARPAPNILMALFAEEIHAVTVAPPAHHLHLVRNTNTAASAGQWAAANAVVKDTALLSMRATE
jgi:hypothetical protein